MAATRKTGHKMGTLSITAAESPAGSIGSVGQALEVERNRRDGGQGQPSMWGVRVNQPQSLDGTMPKKRKMRKTTTSAPVQDTVAQMSNCSQWGAEPR
jgi:hypothetical protein